MGWASFQFDDKRYFYYIIFAFLLLALYIWRLIDKSRMRLALTAIEESELAASSMGVSIIRFKMGITLLSAGLTAMGGVLYAQYITYINQAPSAGWGCPCPLASRPSWAACSIFLVRWPEAP